MGGGLGRVTHHSEYYLDDGSVSFLTKGVLFRVHKTFFQRESEVFRNLFESSVNDDPPPGTDACPFTLDDVTPEDFAQFLWVWYDREYAYRKQPKDNWLTILRLATRWDFKKIKELALREIEFLELPPAERISIYDDYGIDGERFISSCIEMCKSPSVPTQDEARYIKMDTLIKILQAREDAQRRAVELGLETPTSACLEDGDLREIVSKLFGKGLNPRSSGTSTGSGDQAALRTRDTSTITMGEPQVPGRKQTASQPLTDGDGKARQEKGRAESNDMGREGNQREREKKLAEEKEKAEKEKAEREKAEKEKAEKENAEKAKQAKEKTEKEKKEAETKKQREQKPLGTPFGRGRSGNN